VQSLCPGHIKPKALSIPANSVNHNYLMTKNRKFGHTIDLPPPIESMS